MFEAVVVALGLVLSAVSFMLGRIFTESQAILKDKRRVYEVFLSECPSPNDVYKEWSQDLEGARNEITARTMAPILLYGAPSVAHAISVYLEVFGQADLELSPESPAMHESYQKVAQAHNDVILEMRRDALAWSVFGYRGKSRLPNTIKTALGDQP